MHDFRRAFASSALLWSVLALLAACWPAEGATLEGTTWQLVLIREADGTESTPKEARKYTLAFRVEGEVLVRADCNRGRGTWRRQGEHGLVFTDLALTEALCPPGSLHDAYVERLRAVESFTLEERLLLLMVRGGAIIELEPLAIGARPSFDCARAESSVEELICTDAELAGLDVKLQELYERALARFPSEEVQDLKAYQRGWIKGRNDCWKASDLRACVKDSYETRITELQIKSGALVVPEPVSYDCGEGVFVTAVFYNAAQKPAAVLTRGDGEQVIAFLQRSASGAKYEGRNVVFWSKGDEARLTWLGKKRSCERR